MSLPKPTNFGFQLDGRSIHEPIPCKIRQAGDSTWCETPQCGLRWDTNDSNPPRCPRLAVAVQRRSAREVSRAQKRLSALYSEPRSRLWGILDVGGKIALALTLIVALGVLIGSWLELWPF